MRLGTLIATWLFVMDDIVAGNLFSLILDMMIYFISIFVVTQREFPVILDGVLNQKFPLM